MKAEDTVMTDQQIKDLIYSDRKRKSGWCTYISPRDRSIAYAQAEISFKAGIREVVEWIERVRKQKVPMYQLKEWGL